MLPLTGGPSWLWGLIAGQAAAAVWLPAWLTVTLLALAGLAGKSGWFEREPPGLTSSVNSVWEGLGTPGRKWFWPSLAVVAVGWGLREQNFFMGDGWALIDNVRKPFYLHPNEPLDFFTHQLFQRLLTLLGIADGAVAYALLAVLLLPVLLWLTWRMAGLLCRDSRESRTAVFLILAFGGTLQLFLGYVESYTLVNLFACLFLYLGIKALSGEGKGLPWALSIAAALALLSHLSAAMLLPALLFVWLRGRAPAGDRAVKTAKRDFGVILTLCVLGALAGLLFFNPPGLTPLWPSLLSEQAPFTLYDPRYLLFKLNLLLLVAPAAFLLLLAATFGGWRRIGRQERPVFHFLLLSAAGTLFFFFSANAMLGIRDWDLLCLPALPFTVLAAWVFLRLRRSGPGRTLWLGLTALAAAAQTLAFVWVNSSQDSGVAFLDRMLPHEVYVGSNVLQLGFLFEEREYRQEALNQYRAMKRHELSATRAVNLGVMLVQFGKPDSVITVTREILDGLNASPSATGLTLLYSNLSMAYDMIGKPDSALVYFIRCSECGGTIKAAYVGMWVDCLRQRVVQQGWLRGGLDNLSDYDALQLLVRLYALTKDTANMKLIYNRIFQCHFDCGQWRTLLALTRRVVNPGFADRLAARAALECPEMAAQ
ncbi:hypothetical protein LLH00_13050 [bacterium]|nr:hypothetical protein [bacterium]